MEMRKFYSKKRPPQVHIVRLLQNRELGTRRPGLAQRPSNCGSHSTPYFFVCFVGTHFVSGAREFYTNIRLRRSVEVLERPNFIPVRFSYDGRRLIGFSPSLQDVIIYGILFNYVDIHIQVIKILVYYLVIII
jgi:hypothetical protein